jgi:hypothetical protein
MLHVSQNYQRSKHNETQIGSYEAKLCIVYIRHIFQCCKHNFSGHLQFSYFFFLIYLKTKKTKLRGL